MASCEQSVLCVIGAVSAMALGIPLAVGLFGLAMDWIIVKCGGEIHSGNGPSWD